MLLLEMLHEDRLRRGGRSRRLDTENENERTRPLSKLPSSRWEIEETVDWNSVPGALFKLLRTHIIVLSALAMSFFRSSDPPSLLDFQTVTSISKSKYLQWRIPLVELHHLTSITMIRPPQRQ